MNPTQLIVRRVLRWAVLQASTIGAMRLIGYGWHLAIAAALAMQVLLVWVGIARRT